MHYLNVVTMYSITLPFKELYFLRWGVEGFYNLLKGRLNLENFTGKSLESVHQDFWSTIFITHAETIFTHEAQKKLDDRGVPQARKRKEITRK